MVRCKERIRFGVNVLPIRCRQSKHDDDEIAHTGRKAWWRLGARDTSATWGDVR